MLLLSTFRATLFVLIIPYQAVIRISLDLLTIVEIDSKYKVANFAILQYMGNDQMYYAVSAIFLLVVVIVLPFCLIVVNAFCIRYRLYMSFITPMLERFLSVFKNNLLCHSFCAFYFLFRLILLLMSTFWKHDQLQLTLMASFCFIISLLFSEVRPFRQDLYNYFDVVLLFNLAVIVF